MEHNKSNNQQCKGKTTMTQGGNGYGKNLIVRCNNHQSEGRATQQCKRIAPNYMTKQQPNNIKEH
jgi:hypothetical protein